MHSCVASRHKDNRMNNVLLIFDDYEDVMSKISLDNLWQDLDIGILQQHEDFGERLVYIYYSEWIKSLHRVQRMPW
jgi:hypothetical protein